MYSLFFQWIIISAEGFEPPHSSLIDEISYSVAVPVIPRRDSRGLGYWVGHLASFLAVVWDAQFWSYPLKQIHLSDFVCQCVELSAEPKIGDLRAVQACYCWHCKNSSLCWRVFVSVFGESWRSVFPFAVFVLSVLTWALHKSWL